MSRARKPFSSALVAAACAALPAVLIACDKVESDATRADKSVQKVMETTLAQTPSLPPPVRPTSDAEVSKLVQEALSSPRLTKIQAAAREAASASEPTQIEAQAMLGEVAFAEAVRLATALDATEAHATSLLAQIAARTRQIADQNRAIAAANALNPETAPAKPGPNGETLPAPRAAIDKVIADLKAERQAAEARLAELNKKKDELTKEIADLEAKSRDALTRANDLRAKSEAAKGQESVNLFKQSTEARKQAEDLEAVLRQKRVALAGLAAPAPAEEQPGPVSDITVAERHLAAIDAGLKAADAQLKELTDSWAGVQAKIEEHAKVRRELLDNDRPGHLGVNQLAAELGKTLAYAAELRDAIAAQEDDEKPSSAGAAGGKDRVGSGLLTQSIEAYQQAASVAVKYDGDLARMITERSDSPSKKAWQAQRETFNPLLYKLATARSQYARGLVGLRHRQLLDRQAAALKELTAAVQGTQLAAPAGLGKLPDLDKAVAAVTVAAEKDLAAAETVGYDARERPGSGPRSNRIRTDGAALAVAAKYALFRLTGDQSHLTRPHGDERPGAIAVLADMDDAARQDAENDLTKLAVGSFFPMLPDDLPRKLPIAKAGSGGSGGRSTPAPAPRRTTGGGGASGTTPDGASTPVEGDGANPG